MGAVATILVLCSMVMMIAMPMVHGIDESPQAVEKWFEELGQMKEKVTKIHFYLHHTVSGNNISAVEVAQANITSQSPTNFGSIYVVDDPLTVGPELNSTILGRGQGMNAFAGLQEVDMQLTRNFVFTSGKCNGSTLSVLAQDPILHMYREMPIVGGSGVFRLARGIATAQTYSVNTTSSNAVIEFHVIVIHY